MGRAGQTRLGSALEALANIAIGIGINFGANLLILPAVGLEVTLGQAGIITAAFTAVSLARSYLLRRAFTWITARCS